MTKSELRKKYLMQRTLLTDDDYRTACDSIAARFFREVDLSDVRVVHSYLPIEKNKEPDTWLIVNVIQEQYPEIRISIPKINPDGTMTSYYYEGTHQLEESPFGIPEPTHGEITSPEDIDILIVPLLVFDQNGYRVGYGKGFYDRFLMQCKSTSVRVGLSLFPPEEHIDDIAEFDQRMNLVITPEQVYRF
ncbi:MAG: 5-formyltetrahydrofolate cyclo-ligase [Cyclobacteriaceae bacterium]|jgi:5-formyltetrahydrofolate cyclo-ligase|nr:5-formyltetrahydrofolate cyclo-ligase [Cyclobacteriaceae bacterium]